MYASDQEVQRELNSGAEQHECGARSPLQARCVHLARMGCVVFHYDMLGNADSVQIPAAIAHGFSRQRPHLNAPDAWGLFSVRAESYFQSIMGLQTWNTIRSLDFLETLPDVDPTRVAVTGASGGGTQTFMVAAIDPRPAVAFPAVMVGTAMQGGCVCENCSFLRVDTGNVELAALFAPKPQGLTAADDWTKDMVTQGFPELQQLYQMHGAGEQVELTSRLEFGHNYNQVGRQAMYRLVAKHFGLPDFPERPFEVLRDQELSWLATPPAEQAPDRRSAPDFAPETGEAFEMALLQQWRSATDSAVNSALDAIVTAGQDSTGWLAQWRARLRGIYLGSDDPWPAAGEWHKISTARTPAYERHQWLLVNRQSRQTVPIVVYHQPAMGGQRPEQADHICLYFGNAADDVIDSSGVLQPWAAERVAAGQRLICADLIGQGRFVSAAGFQIADRWQMTQRESAGYVLGYNLPLVSQRAQDILQVLANVLPTPTAAGSSATADTGPAGSAPGSTPRRIDLIAAGEGVPALTIATLAGDPPQGLPGSQDAAPPGSVNDEGAPPPTGLTVQLRGGEFRFVDVPSIRDPNFLPGSAILGDLPGFWLLNRWSQVHVDVPDPDWQRVQRVRQAVGAPPLHFQP
jgi:dienelactone hydrolase